MTQPKPHQVVIVPGSDPITTLAAINDAIQTVHNNGGGTVQLCPGVYTIEREIRCLSNVRIKGAGMNATVICRSLRRLADGSLDPHDIGDLIHASSQHQNGCFEGIEIEDLTLDVNQFENSSTPSNLLPHVTSGVDNRAMRGSGVLLWGVRDSAIRRVRVRNAGTWGVNLGHWDGLDEALINHNVVFEDMLFESLSDTSTYEHLLLHNAADVTVRRCRFEHAQSGIAIGLYQHLSNILVDDCSVARCKIGAYYSATVDNVTFRHVAFVDNTCGVQGANLSDNGAFGRRTCTNLLWDDCLFSKNGDGLQLGAVTHSTVRHCVFEQTANVALWINAGNLAVAGQPQYWTIDGCVFRNNNQSDSYHAIHPGILLQVGGGSHYGTIRGCDFVDTQTEKTQTHSVVLSGNAEWDDLLVVGNALHTYAKSGGISPSSVLAIDGASLGKGVQFVANRYVKH